MSMRVLVSSLMLLCATASPLSASDLNSIYQLARANDAQIQASQASLEASREAKPIARSGLLPEIIVSGRLKADGQCPLTMALPPESIVPRVAETLPVLPMSRLHWGFLIAVLLLEHSILGQ